MVSVFPQTLLNRPIKVGELWQHHERFWEIGLIVGFSEPKRVKIFWLRDRYVGTYNVPTILLIYKKMPDESS